MLVQARLVIAGLVVAAILAAGTYVWGLRAALNKARQGQAVAEGQAAVARGQSAAAADVAAITDTARARDARTIIIHERNADAIRTAPGADAPLNPELVRRARLGLCDLAAYAGRPDCAQVRPADPAELPPAGPAGPADTP